MKSKYNMIIKAILKAEGIDVDPHRVMTQVEKQNDCSFGQLKVDTAILECIQAGIYLENLAQHV